jgi:hypothetical protein
MELLEFMDHLEIIYESLARVRKERSRSERDAASIGGILLSITLRLVFRKAQRGRERKSSEEKRTLPPRLRKDTCLMIASKMTFLPDP